MVVFDVDSESFLGLLGESEELSGYFDDPLEDGAGPGQPSHHLYALHLAVLLVGEQPGKIFDFFLVVLSHNILELL